MTRRLFLMSFCLLVAFATLVGTVVPGFAQDQTAPAGQETIIDQAQEQIAQARKQMEGYRDQVEANRTDDLRLVDIKGKVDELGREVIKSTVTLRPRSDEIKGRLAELGDPPKDGQPPEAQIVTEERNRLIAERAQINAVIGDAENLSIDISTFSNAITEIRRQLFTDTLLKRTEVSFDLLGSVPAFLAHEAIQFQDTIGSWLAFVWKFKRIPLAVTIFLSLAAALVLLAGSYRVFGSYTRRDPTVTDPPYITRLAVAFWSTIIQTSALIAFLGLSYFFMSTFNVLRPDIVGFVLVSFAFIGLVYFVWKLTHAVLAPSEPNWRLVRISNRGAKFLVASVVVMAFVNGLDYQLSSISVMLGSAVELTVVKSLVASLIIGSILIVVSFAKPVLNRSGNPEDPGRPWPRYISIMLRLAGAALIAASLIGYIGLARFAATQIVLTGAVLSTMYIGILSGKAVSRQDAFAGTVLGRYLEQRYKLGSVALDQLGIAAGLGIYFIAFLTGIPLILLSWGFQPKDLEQWAVRLFTEITIGSISISLVGIFSGILIFAIGLLATRWFQKWLDGNVMARSHVDGGVRNSIRTGIGYVGVAIAGLIAVSAAGINLSSLALVAGALSLGIGFGLQNIVSNFVSGLILLVERPFKVGDWVVTGTTEGLVKRISVRATEIETFRRQTIIVPNSELINASVGNWTHRNRLGRQEIQVSAAYESDPREVIAILQEVLAANSAVLRNPEPIIEFLRFGESSLDFEMRFFLADLYQGTEVRTAIRIDIFERFREAGIEMPFPQRNLTVRFEDDNATTSSGKLSEALRMASSGSKPKPAEKLRPVDEAGMIKS
ncbi:mechanosensitive ion channel family protein [Rhizobiaceae bacterium n13]|uniref:Mechanosensitive ion channel family protein n=1 Tax=Ferirhizobium litorale TaxID=2927786 RepID=A0AAE3U4X4_9HYPH|nr:mechanosensitive ion channel family protein [Fererhizobium litorale]MDI7863620.1 mechanosensitive ion channel family protein [Fererhizobium litorale]MDI7923459.1 mechanosensitive ion channel family protein [Fererhizobium litorale]